MTDKPILHRPTNPVRFVTAASLFDGHDAAINIMRRILQSQGAEVVHLGHNRSVDEVVTAAIQEDVQGIGLSSYQGGHIEYFKYLIDSLKERGAGHIRVYGGGGGVIVPEEIAELHDYGVARIFSPEDGQRMGLVGMINSMIAECDVDLAVAPAESESLLGDVLGGSVNGLARMITSLEQGTVPEGIIEQLGQVAQSRGVPVLGITGTGGAGKSSLTDELLRRLRLDQEDKVKVAVIAIDPTRRRGGGALLGDRIRMNSINTPTIYFRSIATRSTQSEVPSYLSSVLNAAKAWGADLVIVETPGIGQGDAAIVPYADTSLYVMTPEFGASSQLEKIDMLDFADAVAINKYERRGAEDAMRDVARQMVRNREAFTSSPSDMPVYGTVASRFNDDGVTALYQFLRAELQKHGLDAAPGALPQVDVKASTGLSQIVPAARSRYLAEIAETVQKYHAETAVQSATASRLQQLNSTAELLAERQLP
ncbi:MAG: cobalamin-dependent protein, partial [Microthrixaceae bacterium]